WLVALTVSLALLVARIIVVARRTPVGGMDRRGGGRLGARRVDSAGFGGNGHQLSSESELRSLCTAGVLSNFSIRSASSNRSSTRKRISGENFRLTRRAISPRRNFLLRSSPAITISVSRPPSGIT